jgi:DNA-binding CsgD family transcriptional regulator/PAS domain-containing protein
MSEPLSHQALSELIGSIYDCALDPDRWDRTLAEIGDAFGSRAAMLVLADLRDGRLLINRTVGLSLHTIAVMGGHIPEINAVMADYAALHPSLDEPWVMRRDMALDASPYFIEGLKPQGYVDVLSYFLMRTPTHNSTFTVANDEQAGVITPREIELGGLLLPHLRRAVMISSLLDVRTIERARMAEALDALRCGVVLTNDRAAILHANRAAVAMLREGPLCAAGGVLRAEGAAGRELRKAIGLAARDEAGIGRQGLAIRLSAPEAAPVFAHVLPLTGSDFRTRLRPDAAAAVFIADTPDAGDWARTVAGAFGLTPAETRLLAALLAGQRLAEAATELGIATTTARTHLDSIFAKTGAARQAELMRVAMQVVPPAGA